MTAPQPRVNVCKCGCGTMVTKSFARGHNMRVISDAIVEGIHYAIDDATGCWIWLRSRYNRGYGQYRQQRAHRVMWARIYGPIPDGMLVLHKCDVPSCINPEHLFLGDASDNMRDMVAKGRGVFAHGERNGNAVLTEHNVIDIRARVADGERPTDIANEFNIRRSHVWRIVHGTRWGHVPLFTGKGLQRAHDKSQA